jgi:predicted MFS family arabinose efflux permease
MTAAQCDPAVTAAAEPQATLDPSRSGRGLRPACWLQAAFAVTVIGWGANQFTPLLLMYRAQQGLSAAVVEAMFGVYALGLIPGLLVAGRLSDRIGRRPVVATAVALSMAAAAVLMLGSNGPAWLFAGRLIMGVASGCGFSAGSAWIKELSTPPYAQAGPGAGARRAGVAMTIGFGLGPLVAGAAAQWAPRPTVLPYLPQLVLAAGAAALLPRTRETRPRSQAGPAGPLLRMPRLSRPRFLRVVLPLAPWVFGSAAIAMVYVPGLVLGQLPGAAVIFAALAALGTALSGVLIQPLARRLSRPGRPALLITGMSLVTLGLLAEAEVALLGQPAPVLLGAVVLGCGYGCCLVYGLSEVQRMAPPDELAELTAVFQAATYLGFALPYLLSLLRRYATPAALLLAVAGLAALTLAVTGWQARRTQPVPEAAAADPAPLPR